MLLVTKVSTYFKGTIDLDNLTNWIANIWFKHLPNFFHSESTESPDGNSATIDDTCQSSAGGKFQIFLIHKELLSSRKN